MIHPACADATRAAADPRTTLSRGFHTWASGTIAPTSPDRWPSSAFERVLPTGRWTIVAQVNAMSSYRRRAGTRSARPRPQSADAKDRNRSIIGVPQSVHLVRPCAGLSSVPSEFPACPRHSSPTSRDRPQQPGSRSSRRRTVRPSRSRRTRGARESSFQSSVRRAPAARILVSFQSASRSRRELEASRTLRGDRKRGSFAAIEVAAFPFSEAQIVMATGCLSLRRSTNTAV